MRLPPLLLLDFLALAIQRILPDKVLPFLTVPPGTAGRIVAGLLLKVGLRMRLVELAAASAPFPSHESPPPMQFYGVNGILTRSLLHKIHRIHRKEKKKQKKKRLRRLRLLSTFPVPLSTFERNRTRLT